MFKRYLQYLLLLPFLLNGCVDESDINDFEYKLAVEGWIEEGSIPYVILTQSNPLISTIDTASVENMVIRWAKVSVSDGEQTEVLSGRVDKNYFPPFIYRGGKMIGKSGKTYTLKVEYSGRTWTAETYIPAAVSLQSIESKATTEKDSLFSIEATFNDPATEKNYYKFYTLIKNKNTRYIPSLMGNLDDNLFNGQTKETIVNQGIDQKSVKEFTSHFNVKDTVSVKFCTMSKFGFDYWTAYENELINGQNPLFPANQNLPTNISDGGLGIWCGYAAREYPVIHHQ